MSASSQTSTEKSQSSQPSKVVELDQYWMVSTTKAKDLKQLMDRGLLPNLQIYEWAATKGQSHPTPDTYQAMVFIAYFKCGSGVFSSMFLERIRRQYGIELAYLLPNVVAMLSFFAFLCEA